MSAGRSVDPVWEEKYAAGHAQRYPWDAVVTFIFRNAPRDRPRDEIRILEVGCGAGPNVWFAAREGFSVAGVDASPSAIAAAKQRLADEGLEADLRVADFVSLPFQDAEFDFVIDRGALTCTNRDAIMEATGEIARVTRPGGLFFFNPYSDVHSSSASGTRQPDGTVQGITEGSLVGDGQLLFVSRSDIADLLGPNWDIISLMHRIDSETLRPSVLVHAEWRVIAERR